MIRLALLLVLWAGSASTEEFPALYDVRDVAVGDVLNIRAAQGAGSEILGSFPADRRGIEVVRLSEDGRWGRVNAGELPGWVSMRYLARAPGQEPPEFPMPAVCGGTEPFWDLDLDGDRVVFEHSGIARVAVRASFPRSFDPWTGTRAFVGQTPTDILAGVMRREACSDGMSDMEFGIAIDLVWTGPEGPLHYTGCCTLRSR